MISINSITRGEFKGSWYDPMLSSEQLKALGFNDLPGEVHIEGEYIVNWDGDIPLVEVVSVYAIGVQDGISSTFGMVMDKDSEFPYTFKRVQIELPNFKDVLLADNQIDYGAIEDCIQAKDDGTWAEDALTRAIDRAHDASRDE